MSSTRRSHPRVQAGLECQIATDKSGPVACSGIKNISLGGVFIEMDEPLPFGAEVNLEFRLPVAPRIIKCKGFVVWTTKTHPERSDTPGAGIRLMGLGISDMRSLADYIEEKIVER